MKGFEHISAPAPRIDLRDYEDRRFFPLLVQLPRELAKLHMEHIESIDGISDKEIEHTLQQVLENRERVLTKSVISDDTLKQELAGRERDIFHEVETTIFKSPDIGAGRTARVKAFSLATTTREIPVAVKYLLTPTAKTLSAEAEHDMIWEVERIKEIERRENPVHLRYIHVPHPYFHHKSERVQCYAMERIDGVTLQQIIEHEVEDGMLQKLKDGMAAVEESVLFDEIDQFYEAMHKYCLHGDIKPSNLMLSSDGKVYIIDFGQSVLVTDISENEQNQLENLRESEIEQTKFTLRIIRKILSEERPLQKEAA